MDPVKRLDGLNAQMLTLLTYCYAEEIYDSETIEWAASNDPTVRYICAGILPSWQEIRRFRKANRQSIEQCLVHVATQAMARRYFGGADQPVEPDEACAQVLCWAQRRVELAIMMDTAANE